MKFEPIIAAIIAIAALTLSPFSHSQDNTGQSENEATSAQANTDSVSEPEQDADADAILALLANIDQVQKEILTLDEKHSDSSGEEKQAIALQRHDKYQLLVNELREFNNLTTSYIDKGNDLNLLLEPYREQILQAGSVIRLKIDTYRQRLVDNNLNGDSLTAEGLQIYTEDSEVIDLGYNLLLAYIDLVDHLQFDPAPSRQYLLENLPKRLEFLAGRLQLSAERKSNFQRMLALQSDDTETQSRLLLTEEKLKRDTDSLRQIISIADSSGIDTAAYQSLLVKTTGQISSDILDTRVIGTLFDEWWLETKHNMGSNVFAALFKVVIFFLILFAFHLLSKLVKTLVRRSVESSRLHISILLQNMLVSWASRLVILVGLLVALSQIGISLGPVLAGLGVAGFVIGFALQDTLGNFASGMMILVYRPFDVGDVVEAGGAFGKVENMNIVSTTILTFDNQTLIIPNNKIWGDVIKNVTAQKIRRVDLVFGIGYGDDIAKAEAVLTDIVSQHEKVLAEPAPIIKLHNLGESSVDFVVRPWCSTADYWDVYWDITRAVKMRFDAEGISIPFPQRDVHIYQANTATKVE